MLKIKIVFILYFLIAANVIPTKVIANDTKTDNSLYVGVSGHTLESLPMPAFELGFDTTVASMRVRFPFLAVGRMSMELAARYESNIKAYPYVTYGRSYYVLGFHSFVGVGIEYVFKNGRSYFLVEMTRQGLRPGESDIDFNPRNTLTFGFGVRNYNLW